MPLAQFGVIDVAGDDAATFLHSQLTNDIEHLDAASARLSGYCSPKGRLLASFLAWRAGHGVRLLVSKDVQAAVQKRLSMFVLRAKAKLTDATDTLAMVGFAGDVRDALSGIFDALPDGVHVKVDGPAGALIRVPDAAGRKRYLWIGPRAEVDARLHRRGIVAHPRARADTHALPLDPQAQVDPRHLRADVEAGRVDPQPAADHLQLAQAFQRLERTVDQAHVDAERAFAGVLGPEPGLESPQPDVQPRDVVSRRGALDVGGLAPFEPLRIVFGVIDQVEHGLGGMGHEGAAFDVGGHCGPCRGDRGEPCCGRARSARQYAHEQDLGSRQIARERRQG